MLDDLDKQILNELTENSRITMKKLGEKVHLTGQAAAMRIAKLEESGVIEKFTIQINQEKINYPIHAFITIKLTMANNQPLINFLKSQDQHIVSSYKVSGEGCYLLETRFPSNQVLEQFIDRLNDYAKFSLSIVINNRI